MKYISFIVTVVCMTGIMVGCKTTRQSGFTSKDKPTIISGIIKGVDASEFKFIYDSYALLEDTRRIRIPIDSNGYFHYTLEMNAPITGQLDFGRDLIKGRGYNKWIYTYLEPGDSIFISADVDFNSDTNVIENTLYFSGNNVSNNRFVNDYEFEFNSYQKLRQNNYGLIVQLDPVAYENAVDSICDEKLLYMKTYDDTSNLSSFLKKIYREQFENLASAQKINYPYSKKNFSKLKELSLPENYYDFMDEIHTSSNLENAGVPYLRFTHFYLKNKYALEKKQGLNEDYTRFLDKELNKRAKYIYMAYSLRTDFDAAIYGKFEGETPYKDIQAIVKKKYGYLEGMLPGKPAPEVVFENLDDQALPSKEVFANKVVYLDFWATWCKPCIAEIPDLVKLEEEYKDKNIEFISVSFDEEKDTWKNFVKRRSLQGVQLWVSPTNKGIFDKRFNIREIPRFALIDSEGKIVNADAPRPSSGREIRDILDKTLQ